MAVALLWGFILFLALSYFRISIEQIVNSPIGQENLAYLAHVLTLGWQWLGAHIGPFFAWLKTQVQEFKK